MEEVDYLSKQPDSIGISVSLKLGTEYFLEKMWEYLDLVRVYTKKVIFIYSRKVINLIFLILLF
jgi:ribosome-interacting GTPase 1